MDDSERDQLLARLDERSEAIHGSLSDLKVYIVAVDRKTQATAKIAEKHESDINWIKWVGSSVLGILASILGITEWLNK